MKKQNVIGSENSAIPNDRVKTIGLTLNKNVICFLEIVPAIEGFSHFKVRFFLDNEEDISGTGPTLEMEEWLPLESIPADIGISSIRDLLTEAKETDLEQEILNHLSIGLASIAEIELVMDGSLQICAEVKLGEFVCKNSFGTEFVEFLKDVAKFDGEESF